jgi:SAM-dependent methyltransferase
MNNPSRRSNLDDTEKNRMAYCDPGVVQAYARFDGLAECESSLFQHYVPADAAILDLGVGGDRTTPFLSERASRYLGVDNSAAMVEACHSRFPSPEFMLADAKDLTPIGNGAFDVVVFSFNGIDCFTTSEARRACPRTVWRVLRPGGVFIFSSHHARALAHWPKLDHAKAHQVGWRFARFAMSVLKTLGRPSFCGGEGCGYDPVDGGLYLYAATPSIYYACRKRGI